MPDVYNSSYALMHSVNTKLLGYILFESFQSVREMWGVISANPTGCLYDLKIASIFFMWVWTVWFFNWPISITEIIAMLAKYKLWYLYLMLYLIAPNRLISLLVGTLFTINHGTNRSWLRRTESSCWTGQSHLCFEWAEPEGEGSCTINTKPLLSLQDLGHLSHIPVATSL